MEEESEDGRDARQRRLNKVGKQGSEVGKEKRTKMVQITKSGELQGRLKKKLDGWGGGELNRVECGIKKEKRQ